jgi:4-amino-4-deoxy-L-arabinose transferase-like glycosyltransferase
MPTLLSEVISKISMVKHKKNIGLILAIIWLTVIGAIAFLWNLGTINLIDETEPLFAEASRQMIVRGDWITPYFNEQTRFDKPPLIYWLQAIAYLLIGVNEWAVRLPSALSAIGLIVLLFYTLNKFANPENKASFTLKLLPFFGSGMLAFNLETIAWGRSGVSDMLLTGCMGGALLAFFLGYAETKPATIHHEHKPEKFEVNLWYLAFYILIALGILAKGPVGIVLPALIISLFLLYLGQFKSVLAEMQAIRGLLIILFITLPWYILVTWANGQEYINSFFGYHNFERFTSVVNRHSAPWYFYFVVVLLGFAPWSLYLPLAIARLKWWQRNYWQRQPRSQQLGLFALCWFVAIFGFFTIAATKLPSYVLPLMPAAAILVALLFTTNYPESRVSESSEKLAFPKSILINGWINVVFWLLLAVACFSVYRLLNPDPAMPNFAQALQASGVPIVGSIILGAIAVISGLFLVFPNQIIAANFRGLNKPKSQKQKLSVSAEKELLPGYGLWAINFIGFLAFFIFALMPTLIVFNAERQQPVREMAAILKEIKQPEEEILMIAFEKPSLVFYSQQPVTFFRRSTDALDYLKNKAAEASSPTSVLILGLSNKLEGAGVRSPHYKAFYEITPYQLVRVNLEIFRPLTISEEK